MIDFPADITSKPVYNRVNKVLQYCEWKIPHFDGLSPGTQIPIRAIQAEFGPNKSALALWLRDFLLIKTKNYGVDIKRCNEYALNYPNWQKLTDYINSVEFKPKRNHKEEKLKQLTKNIQVDLSKIDHKLITSSYLPIMKQFPILTIKQAIQLTTGNFEYSRGNTSNRYINSIQSIPTELRDEIFYEVGFKYNYDFDACAPTIFLHLAKTFGLVNGILIEPIQHYLDNKEYYRTIVYDIIKTGNDDKAIKRDKKSAKQLINGLFNGARLAKTPYCTIFNNLLKRNEHKMELLQNNKDIRSLIRAINYCWRRMSRMYYLQQLKDASYSERRQIVKNYFRKGTNKWGLYYMYETKLIDIIKNNMKEEDVNYFIEHDGFRTNKQVNVENILIDIFLLTKLTMSIKMTELHKDEEVIITHKHNSINFKTMIKRETIIKNNNYK